MDEDVIVRVINHETGMATGKKLVMNARNIVSHVNQMIEMVRGNIPSNYPDKEGTLKLLREIYNGRK